MCPQITKRHTRAMTVTSGSGGRPSFEVGDRVVAARHIGGQFRPRVRRGETGIVVACAHGGELEVHFANGHRELTTAEMLTLVEDPTV